MYIMVLQRSPFKIFDPLTNLSCMPAHLTTLGMMIKKNYQELVFYANEKEWMF